MYVTSRVQLADMIKPNKYFTRCFFWLALLFSLVAQAQSPLQLINDTQTIRLSEHVRIFAEPDSALTLDQIIKRKDQFSWFGSSNPNYGLYENGLWLHTSLSNVTDTEEWVIDIGFSHLDKVDFYLLNGNTLLASSKQGELRGSQEYRYPTMGVDLPYATTLDLYIRLEAKDKGIIAPLDIQSHIQYMRFSFWDNLLWGLFYGGLMILALYNLVLYFANKESSLLAYVCYIVSVLIWQFVWGGHLSMLFPSGITPWLSRHMDLIFVMIGIASGIFTYTFLDAKNTAPKTTAFIKTNLILLTIMGFCSVINIFPALWQNALVYLVSLFAIASYLVAGFESYNNKFRSARYFIFAWTILASSAIVGMLSLVGILPTNDFTTYCFQVGVFLEAGLFSLALMDKSRNELEKEIQQATKDLRNNMEFIEEQNARLDIARKDAINASHIKSQFLANMSHEIRTPLNAILGFSKELTKVPLPPDKQEHVRIINSAADSLLSIVNDVLDVSKIEAGKLHINNLPFSPNEVLEEMVSVMAKSAHQKQLEFIFDLAPLPERLVGDAQRVKQILTNLLGNALKFTSHGYICLSTKGEILDNDIFEWELTVEDSGIGISQQDRKKLFNAFSQVDDAISRPYQGTGLGLVICQQLVNLMNGKITLTSAPGHGSCFTVTLRVNLLNKTSCFAENTYLANQHVLLYDPNENSRLTTGAILSNAGAIVTSLSSLQALKLYQIESYYQVYAALPFNKIHERNTTLFELAQLKPSTLILLYSGDEPHYEPNELQQTNIGILRLPLTINKLASLSQSPTVVDDHHPHEALTALAPAKVLAVDDMEMNLRLLRTWLRPSPLELTLAYSGEDAVALCQQQEFDLILMDVQMPNMDGLQASRLIRQTDLNLGTPIIAVTAHALKEEQERLMASGMDDYLPKPLDLIDLITVIKRWCGNVESVQGTFPSIDWSVALKRANHNADAAKEVLEVFLEQLPAMLADIENSWKLRDMTQLQVLVHKLHGACCYTGVPNLQNLCDELESSLKLQEEHWVETKMPDLLAEGRQVINQGLPTI